MFVSVFIFRGQMHLLCSCTDTATYTFSSNHNKSSRVVQFECFLFVCVLFLSCTREKKQPSIHTMLVKTGAKLQCKHDIGNKHVYGLLLLFFPPNLNFSSKVRRKSKSLQIMSFYLKISNQIDILFFFIALQPVSVPCTWHAA